MGGESGFLCNRERKISAFGKTPLNFLSYLNGRHLKRLLVQKG